MKTYKPRISPMGAKMKDRIVEKDRLFFCFQLMVPEFESDLCRLLLANSCSEHMLSICTIVLHNLTSGVEQKIDAIKNPTGINLYLSGELR